MQIRLTCFGVLRGLATSGRIVQIRGRLIRGANGSGNGAKEAVRQLVAKQDEVTLQVFYQMLLSRTAKWWRPVKGDKA